MTLRAHLATLALLAGAFLAPTARAAQPAPDIDAATRKLLDQWKARLDAEHFNYLVAPPFVIAGNADPARLATYRDATILSATRRLQKQFFKAKPTEPVLVLLFESAGPYKRLARKWFDDDDVPYYGFFRHDNVMLMNVGTGTGTLVHELTHALIKPDFPAVPSWFNEGFASLFEQCTFGPGDTILGLENWRLPGLQKAIRAGTLRPLDQLARDPNFYAPEAVGVNYAQARYLMLYLQHKGLLKTYYTTFRDNARADPTGLEALKKVVAPQPLDAFEKEWRAWVLTLRFGP